jgi:uncharacterized protein (TIGR00725 family)
MGGGHATPSAAAAAYRLGALIAENQWILLNGGRNSGIMAASAEGAKDHGGLTVGILPDDNRRRASPSIDIPIVTGMGSARNLINVLSSDIVVACPGGMGTLSEIALALKCDKPVILMGIGPGAAFEAYRDRGRLIDAPTPEDAVDIIKKLLSEEDRAL